MSTVAYPIGVVKDGHCGWCGALNPPSRGVKPRKWCSDICSRRAAEFRRTGKAPLGSAREIPAKCAGCGTPIEQGSRMRNPRKWCSDSCRVKHSRGTVDKRSSYYRNMLARAAEEVRRKNLSSPDIVCPNCGEVTPRTDSGRPLRYCNDKCQSAASYRRRKAVAPKCTEDGCDRPSISRGLCGSHYSAVWRADNPDKHTAKNLRYRAQKQHEGAELFSRIEVMELSDWTCHLCGEPIDRDCPYPSQLYGTVDHVVPLSRGGTHTLDNVMAAHHVCNSTKKDNQDYVHLG